jgi:hypothetical protein
MLHAEKTSRRIVMALVLAAAPYASWAEEPQPAPPAKDAGPLTIERLHSGFVIAPDNRFAEVDGHFGNFVGGYAGWSTDRTLLVGVGGYWLTNDPNRIDMGYGGALVEWVVRGDRRFTLSTRALIGGGGATVTDTLANLGYPTDGRMPVYDDPRHGEPYGRHGFPPGPPTPLPGDTRVRVHDGFFVAEPQVNACLRLKEWLRLDAGVGYRFIAGTHNLNDRLHGVSGSLSLQLGGS